MLDAQQVEGLLHLLSQGEEIEFYPCCGVTGITQLLGQGVDTLAKLIDARTHCSCARRVGPGVP